MIRLLRPAGPGNRAKKPAVRSSFYISGPSWPILITVLVLDMVLVLVLDMVLVLVLDMVLVLVLDMVLVLVLDMVLVLDRVLVLVLVLVMDMVLVLVLVLVMDMVLVLDMGDGVNFIYVAYVSGIRRQPTLRESRSRADLSNSAGLHRPRSYR